MICGGGAAGDTFPDSFSCLVNQSHLSLRCRRRSSSSREVGREGIKKQHKEGRQGLKYS